MIQTLPLLHCNNLHHRVPVYFTSSSPEKNSIRKGKKKKEKKEKKPQEKKKYKVKTPKRIRNQCRTCASRCFLLFPFPNPLLFRNDTEKNGRFPTQERSWTKPPGLELHQVGSIALAQREGGRDVSGELGNLLDVREQGGVDVLLVRLARLGGLLFLKTPSAAGNRERAGSANIPPPYRP